MSTKLSVVQDMMAKIETALNTYNFDKNAINLANTNASSVGAHNGYADIMAAQQVMNRTVEDCIVSLMSVRHGLIVAQYAGSISASREEILAAIIEVDAAIQSLSTQFCDLVTSARNRFYS